MINNLSIVSVKYDALGDVLYLATDTCQKTRTREDDNGLLMRCTTDGRVVGITVEDFGYIWCKRQDELAEIIAPALNADINALRESITRECR